MTVPTIGDRASLQHLVDVVEASRASHVAVVDDFGRLLGAIDTADHPDLFAGADGPRVAGTPRHRRRRDARRHTAAGDLMADAVVVGEDWSTARAAHTLTTAGADVAYVVDDLGCVRGTVTIRQCRPAPAAHTVPKEAGRDQVRV
ncbi:CBS domain-containing protein [Dactylosporangium sp. NPDC049742]|uniref:CBS domain-containing protein n=1 Tax=Dactylosporangium sp. NPDC049742 TaxID=3154737 RepID=UPI0034175661